MACAVRALIRAAVWSANPAKTPLNANMEFASMVAVQPGAAIIAGVRPITVVTVRSVIRVCVATTQVLAVAVHRAWVVLAARSAVWAWSGCCLSVC